MSAPVDHPPPLCPECHVREAPASFVLCSSCAEASSVCPAPWNLKDGALRDANGTALVSGNDGRVDGDGEPIPGPIFRDMQVYRLIQAAPEMERMLRRLEWVTDEDIGGPVCPVCGGMPKDRGGDGHQPARDTGGGPCPLAALLARLDEARRG